MNQFLRKYFWLVAMVISVSASPANADDLFDDSFFADPAPADAVKSADANKDTASAVAQEKKVAEAPAVVKEVQPQVDKKSKQKKDSTTKKTSSASLDKESEKIAQNTTSSKQVPPLEAPSAIPAPSAAVFETSAFDAPAVNKTDKVDFQASGMNLSTPPSEQILGKVSSDIFREMAEMERENSTLMLQLKREQLRSEIDALKTANRQLLFDEIERREKMTQARLEWELAQDLKRQEALERKQRAEIRQKQIEAALKREEDRRIQKMKDEEAARIQKEKEEKEAIARKQEELKKKYDAASLVRINNLKPVLMAVTKPEKIKRIPASSRISNTLTSRGADLLSKKKAGEALSTVMADKSLNANVEPASALYAVSEIRGTAGSLIAKLISKKDKITFFVKKSTVLPSGHTVIDIDKDFVLVQMGKTNEMIGFPSAGLLTDLNDADEQEINNNQGNENIRYRYSSRKRSRPPVAATVNKVPTFSGASLAQ